MLKLVFAGTPDVAVPSLKAFAADPRFDVVGVITLPEGTDMVMPGDTTEISVQLIQPIAMEPGLGFAIREGGRTVGSGRVTKIIK